MKKVYVYRVIARNGRQKTCIASGGDYSSRKEAEDKLKEYSQGEHFKLMKKSHEGWVFDPEIEEVALTE